MSANLKFTINPIVAFFIDVTIRKDYIAVGSKRHRFSFDERIRKPVEGVRPGLQLEEMLKIMWSQSPTQLDYTDKDTFESLFNEQVRAEFDAIVEHELSMRWNFRFDYSPRPHQIEWSSDGDNYNRPWPLKTASLPEEFFRATAKSFSASIASLSHRAGMKPFPSSHTIRVKAKDPMVLSETFPDVNLMKHGIVQVDLTKVR